VQVDHLPCQEIPSCSLVAGSSTSHGSLLQLGKDGLSMQGCSHPRLAFQLLILCLVAPGCGTSQPSSPDTSSPPMPAAGTHFDPATAGTLRGRVTWQGDLPVVPPFLAHSPPLP